MDDNDLQTYTPKQQRMLEFLAAYLEISTDELELRIVAVELDDLEDVLGVYADAQKAAKPKGKLSRVLDFPLGGGKDD